MKVIDGKFDGDSKPKKDAQDLLQTVLNNIVEESSKPDECLAITYNNITGEYRMYTNADVPNSLFLLLQAQRHVLEQ